jgi:hypothetical protein
LLSLHSCLLSTAVELDLDIPHCPTLAPVQIFDGVCWLSLKLRIDEPLSAAPMHGFGGLWGVFFTGLRAKPEYVQQAYGTDMNVSGGPGDRLGFRGLGSSTHKLNKSAELAKTFWQGDGACCAEA